MVLPERVCLARQRRRNKPRPPGRFARCWHSFVSAVFYCVLTSTALENSGVQEEATTPTVKYGSPYLAYYDELDLSLTNEHDDDDLTDRYRHKSAATGYGQEDDDMTYTSHTMQVSCQVHFPPQSSKQFQGRREGNNRCSTAARIRVLPTLHEHPLDMISLDNKGNKKTTHPWKPTKQKRILTSCEWKTNKRIGKKKAKKRPKLPTGEGTSGRNYGPLYCTRDRCSSTTSPQCSSSRKESADYRSAGKIDKHPRKDPNFRPTVRNDRVELKPPVDRGMDSGRTVTCMRKLVGQDVKGTRVIQAMDKSKDNREKCGVENNKLLGVHEEYSLGEVQSQEVKHTAPKRKPAESTLSTMIEPHKAGHDERDAEMEKDMEHIQPQKSDPLSSPVNTTPTIPIKQTKTAPLRGGWKGRSETSGPEIWMNESGTGNAGGKMIDDYYGFLTKVLNIGSKPQDETNNEDKKDLHVDNIQNTTNGQTSGAEKTNHKNEKADVRSMLSKFKLGIKSLSAKNRKVAPMYSVKDVEPRSLSAGTQRQKNPETSEQNSKSSSKSNFGAKTDSESTRTLGKNLYREISSSSKKSELNSNSSSKSNVTGEEMVNNSLVKLHRKISLSSKKSEQNSDSSSKSNVSEVTRIVSPPEKNSLVKLYHRVSSSSKNSDSGIGSREESSFEFKSGSYPFNRSPDIPPPLIRAGSSKESENSRGS